MSGQQPKVETYKHDLELEYQVRIGSKQFPEYPIRSAAEEFTQLRKTMRILGSTVGNVDINNESMRNYITSLPLIPKQLYRLDIQDLT